MSNSSSAEDVPHGWAYTPASKRHRELARVVLHGDASGVSGLRAALYDGSWTHPSSCRLPSESPAALKRPRTVLDLGPHAPENQPHGAQRVHEACLGALKHVMAWAAHGAHRLAVPDLARLGAACRPLVLHLRSQWVNVLHAHFGALGTSYLGPTLAHSLTQVQQGRMCLRLHAADTHIWCVSLRLRRLLQRCMAPSLADVREAAGVLSTRLKQAAQLASLRKAMLRLPTARSLELVKGEEELMFMLRSVILDVHTSSQVKHAIGNKGASKCVSRTHTAFRVTGPSLADVSIELDYGLVCKDGSRVPLVNADDAEPSVRLDLTWTSSSGRTGRIMLAPSVHRPLEEPECDFVQLTLNHVLSLVALRTELGCATTDVFTLFNWLVVPVTGLGHLPVHECACGRVLYAADGSVMPHFLVPQQCPSKGVPGEAPACNPLTLLGPVQLGACEPGALCTTDASYCTALYAWASLGPVPVAHSFAVSALRHNPLVLVTLASVTCPLSNQSHLSLPIFRTLPWVEAATHGAAFASLWFQGSDPAYAWLLGVAYTAWQPAFMAMVPRALQQSALAYRMCLKRLRKKVSRCVFNLILRRVWWLYMCAILPLDVCSRSIEQRSVPKYVWPTSSGCWTTTLVEE